MRKAALLLLVVAAVVLTAGPTLLANSPQSWASLWAVLAEPGPTAVSSGPVETSHSCTEGSTRRLPNGCCGVNKQLWIEQECQDGTWVTVYTPCYQACTEPF